MASDLYPFALLVSFHSCTFFEKSAFLLFWLNLCIIISVIFSKLLLARLFLFFFGYRVISNFNKFHLRPSVIIIIIVMETFIVIEVTFVLSCDVDI